ncbi:MAG TPA: fused MFS/spermidine synthase [Solirubrobacterales bacterium]|nr:fused MFS/spermidine synthase [Solirubrobacterales bacterium]
MGTEEVVAGGGGESSAEPGLPRALPMPAAAALVFVAAGAVLMLEILAVRLLAPYVGLTLETTTSIIGAALGGIALGAAVGGYFADRTNTYLLIVGLLIGGGLLTLLTVPVVHWLGPGARGDGDAAALGITVVALVPAAAVLSAVSPAVAHLQLHDLRASGTIVGRLSAWATAGALIGTFGTGFVLVPLLPVDTAVLLIGAVLVAIGLGLAAASPLVSIAAVAGIALVAVAFGALTVSADSPCERQSKYHCLSLVADRERPDSFELLLDDAYNSYADASDPTHLDYAYTRWIAEAIDRRYPGRRPLDAVFVGGGALTLPRWLDATHPGSRSQVLEVDEEIVDLVETRLDLPPEPAVQVSIGDARVTMLDLPTGSADVVVGDAYSGYTVPWHLTTEEWAEEVERVLKPRGFYAVNLIDYPPFDFVKAEAKTLFGSFEDVEFAAYLGADEEPAGGNLVMFAAGRPLPWLVHSKRAQSEGVVTFDDSVVRPFAAGAEVLRDDFAPVDQLRSLG